MVEKVRMSKTDLMIHYMLHHTGKPYLWGGDDPILGFDCSGFTQEFLKAFGVLPNKSADLSAHELYLKMITCPKIENTGALAFYGTQEKVIHIAPIIFPGFIFEFGGGGSTTTSLEAAANQNAYGRVRPKNHRGDLVNIYMPYY